jgi:glycolate oxidase FAD binding subunit
VISSLNSHSVRSVDDVRSVVLHCVNSNLAIVPIGGGTNIHIGNAPSRSSVTLSTLGLNTIVEYDPKDLVVIAEAGVTLTSLQAVLREHGQWLPIDVAAPDRQTLGGIVSCRANSSLRPGYGSLRDWLIGVEVVNSQAEVVIGGGKVVKNVSGYDLPKLYLGSWGTLGVLTKVNFKVSPIPVSDRSLLIVLSADRNAEDLINSILTAGHATSAMLFNRQTALRVLGDSSEPAQYLLVRYHGLSEDVDSQIEQTADAAAPFASSVVSLPELLAGHLWRMLTDFPLAQAPLTATYHILSSQVGAHVRMTDWIAQKHGLRAEVTADVACGIVTAHVREAESIASWSSFLPEFLDKANRVGGSLIVERMPDDWRESGVPIWSPVLPDFRLMQLVKKNLDPNNLFSPGRFFGGI